jgi:hypothetical protein
MPVLIAALMAAAAGADPQLPPPKTVSPLVVTAQPKEAPPADVTLDMSNDSESIDGQAVAIWSAKAWNAGTNGKVVLTCFVDVHGIAERCRIAWESPQGSGLGAAALAAQANFHLDPPKGPDGQPMAREENIALAFKKSEFDNNIGDVEKGLASDFTFRGNPLAMRKIVMMSHPVWVAAPSFDDLARNYPTGTGQADAYVVVHCEVKATGDLKNCFPAKHYAPRRVFEAAAVRLAEKFKVSPEVMKYAPHGDPIEVDVPIRFPPKTELAERKVVAPAWLAGVDPEAMPKVYPPEAAAKGVGKGHGVARCTVAADGSLTGCQAESSDPDGLGFGEAAAKLAATLRMNLWSSDAQPVQGGTVHVAIQLNLAGG